MRKHSLLLVAGLSALLAILLVWTLAQPDDEPTTTPIGGPLEDQKLREEIRQLELENDRLASDWQPALNFAPYLTGLAAIVTVGVTIWKQMDDRRRQLVEEHHLREAQLKEDRLRRIADRRQRIADRRQQRQEDLRRFDANFAALVQNLGCDSASLQASAAASLMTFLTPRYNEEFDTIFSVLVANLRIERDRIVQDVLARVFEQAIRLYLNRPRSDQEHAVLDLSRAQLQRVNLENLDFRGVDVDVAFANLRHANIVNVTLPKLQGYGAILEGARLSRANLQEARLNHVDCIDAQFHASVLVSATFKEAKLRGAQFHQAHLQSAHFENADLSDAQFQDADLNDTFFRGAVLNDQSLQSITRARHWRNAHFDEQVMEQLQLIAANRSR